MPLAEWARAQFLFAGDPLDAIADWIAQIHSAGHDAQSPSASLWQEGRDDRDGWDGLLVLPRHFRWRGCSLAAVTLAERSEVLPIGDG